MSDNSETNKELSLLEAVSNVDIDRVKLLVEAGVSVNTKGRDNGNTPLHIAAIKQSLQLVEYLLNIDDVEIDARNREGLTPLHVTVSQNIGYGANRPDGEIDIPLRIAFGQIPTPIEPNLDILDMLIKAGADINAKDYNGNTLLHKTVYYHCLDVMYQLLYYNVDSNIINIQEQTPFMLTILCRYQDMEDVFLDYVDVNVHKFIIKNYFDSEDKITQPYLTTFRVLWLNWNCRTNELCNLLFKLTELVEVSNLWRSLIVVQYVKIIINTWIDPNHLEPIDEPEPDEPPTPKITEPAIVHRTECRCIRLVIGLFQHRSLDRETAEKYIYTLLTYNFQLSVQNIHYAFEQFGHCELIRIILHMDFPPTGQLDTDICRYIFPIILYDVRRTINDLLYTFERYLPYYIRNMPIQNVEVYVRTMMEFSKYFSYYKVNDSICRLMVLPEYHELIRKIRRLPTTPKLREICRNQIRDNIIRENGFTKSCQYYTFVQNMDILGIYKRILSFAYPLYQ